MGSVAVPALADEPSTSFSHRVAQGRFLLEQGMFQPAFVEFEAAAAMPQGQSDPDVHTLLARTAFKTGRVSRAVDAVQKARALSGSSPSADLAELHEFLTTRFGKVLVIGATAEGAHTPEPAVPILDPELKRVFEAAVAGLGKPSGGGSTSIYLPVGTYRVGRHLVEVRAEGSTRMDLRPTVGSAGRGVYGEKDGGGRRGGERPAPRAPAPPVSQLSLRLGGQGFQQQNSPSGGGRFLAGWEGHFLGAPLALRAAGGVGVHRLERIQATRPAPPGIVPTFQVAVGPRVQLGPLDLVPAVAVNVGYGRTLDPGLPPGYAGPRDYLVFGPDIEVRLLLPGSLGRTGARVRPDLGARLVVREIRPLGPGSEGDPRPHWMVGAGIDLGLLVAGP